MKDASPLPVPTGETEAALPHAHPAWDPDPPDDALDFATLRQAAIATSQDASGKIWTDYNLHDPGVTLLEQTAFALSELAYFGDHPVRDHLTKPINILSEANPSPAFDAEALALFDPRDVLPGRPVTLRDLARYLSDIDEVERVFVRRSNTRGLLDFLIIPQERYEGRAERASPTAWRDPVAAVKDAFDRERLLTVGLGRAELAHPVDVWITGKIEISPLSDPNIVAAEIWHRVGMVLYGRHAQTKNGTQNGTLRSDLFEDPSDLWTDLDADSARDGHSEALVAAIHKIQSVLSVQNLRLCDPANPSKPLPQRRAKEYFRPSLPPENCDPTFALFTEDGALGLDLEWIERECRRLRAQFAANAGKKLDPTDWDVLAPGRHRPFARTHIDAMLPAAYTIASSRSEQASLADYRAMLDGCIGDIANKIETLDRQFAAKAEYDPEDARSVEQRVSVLDHLLALQGEKLPTSLPKAFHALRSHRQQAVWSVQWRESILENLPQLNRYQGCANRESGVPARLALLTDLTLRNRPDPLTPVEALGGINLGEEPVPDPETDASNYQPPNGPTGPLVPRDDAAEPFPTGELSSSCAWVSQANTVSEDLFRHAAKPSSYAVLQHKTTGRWHGMLTCPKGTGFYATDPMDTQEDATVWAQRACNSWIALNTASENIAIIEDLALRSGASDFTPALAWAVMGGFGLRTIDPGFRAYVEGQIARTVPAHVLVRTVWLKSSQARDIFETARTWENGEKASGPNLRAKLMAFAAREDAQTNG